MTNNFLVRGTLIPSRPTAITAEMADILNTTFDKHKFPGSFSDSLVGAETIFFETSIERVKEENLPANVTESGLQWELLFAFTDALEDVLSNEAIKKLRLNGSLLVTVESDETPVLFFLTIENNQVWYQPAHLVASE